MTLTIERAVARIEDAIRRLEVHARDAEFSGRRWEAADLRDVASRIGEDLGDLKRAVREAEP